MLKIFLVEDELIVREGIKNNINWAGEGFEFCGEAADGELALPLIQSEQPDIIITDIRMPFMDGLELSRIVKKELPQCKIIILSGHEEFSYAQEAIRIGVTQYLLKPINSTELIEVVKRIGRQILREREERENYERYRQEMAEAEQNLKLRLFNEMIAGSLSIYKILERGQELGLKLSAKSYRVVLLKYSHASFDETFSTELLSLTEEFIRLNTYTDNILLFDRAIEGWALLIKGESPEHLDSIWQSFLDDLKALFHRYPDVRYFGGIGSVVDRLTRLNESFESAQRAFAQRFVLDRNDIIDCDTISAQRQGSENMRLDAQELGSLDLTKVEDFLRGGELGEVLFFVEKLLNHIGGASARSLLFRQYVFMDIYVTVITFLKNIGDEGVLSREPFSNPEQMIELVNDPDKVKDYLVKLFTEALMRREALRTKRYHHIIEQVKSYICENYAEDISLNDVAEYVNISPSHLSSVFSRETGQSFIRYLTEFRMSKAKELLKCSDLLCAEIGLRVGYKDPHYFSYLFKKMFHCSPTQYRHTAQG